jgi:hypothetical protein
VGDVYTGTLHYAWYASRPVVRPDEGNVYYGGTLVLDIPAAARGRYAVNLNADQTFLCECLATPADIPTAVEAGFFVNIVTGSCCYGLGSPSSGCGDKGLPSRHREFSRRRSSWRRASPSFPR